VSLKTSDGNILTNGDGYQILVQETVKARRINVLLTVQIWQPVYLANNCPNSTVEHRIESHNALFVNDERRNGRSFRIRLELGKVSVKS
jgi:hypothetical protein